MHVLLNVSSFLRFVRIITLFFVYKNVAIFRNGFSEKI